MNHRLLWIPLIAAFFLGCGNDELPDYFLLDRLRVLGANTVGGPAEFSAGDAGIQIEFHVSDPLGAGRTLTYSIEACVDPGIGYGATPTCAGNPTRSVITASGSFTPGSAATNYYGVLTTPAFAVPASGVIYLDPTTGAARPAYDQANGVGYLVFLNLVAPSGETLSSFKRVIVSTKGTKNQNPAFGTPALLFAGADASSYTLTTELFAMNSNSNAGNAESYVVEKSDGSSATKVETLTVTWLVTAGEVRTTRTDPGVENRFTPPAPLPAKTSFIAVLRDDRGGTAVVTYHK